MQILQEGLRVREGVEYLSDFLSANNDNPLLEGTAKEFAWRTTVFALFLMLMKFLFTLHTPRWWEILFLALLIGPLLLAGIRLLEISNAQVSRFGASLLWFCGGIFFLLLMVMGFGLP